MSDRLLDDGFRVHLTGFDGPLDLLLHLVRSHEVDPRDLPLSRVTGEYLEIVRFMESIDLEPVSEFLEVAAALVRFKAQSLLPSPTTGGDADDLAAEEEALLEQLVEHQVAKMAAHELRAREARTAAVWFRGEEEPGGIEATRTEVVEADLFALVDAFRNVLQELEVPRDIAVSRDDYPVSVRADAIRRRLEEGEPVPFEELFTGDAPRGKLIATFLALLELIRSGEARALQEENLGRILIFPASVLEETS